MPQTTDTKAPILSDRQIALRLLRYIRTRVHWILLGMTGYLIFAVANGLYADAVKQLIDYIAREESKSSFAIIKSDWLDLDTSTFIVVFIAGIAIARSLGAFCGMFGINRLAHEIIYLLRNDLHLHYLGMLSKDFDKHNAGALTAKMNFTIDQISGAVSEGLIVLVRELLTCVVLLSVMIYYSWKLTLLSIAVLPIVAFIIVIASRYFRKVQTKIQSNMENISHLITEVVTGHVIVKTFRAKRFERDRFIKANNDFLRNNIKNVFVNAFSVPSIQVILAMTNAYIIWIALQDSFIENMTAGSFVAFFVAMGLLVPAVRKLSNINYVIQKGLVAARDVFTILDQPNEDDEKGTISLWRTSGAVRFDNVSFIYQSKKNHTVLNGINFSVAGNKTVAVIGKSGSGKSTLIKLLLRLYDQTSGEIYIDNLPISQLTLSSLRQQISVVIQNNILFNDTVAHNVAYGETDEIIDQARLIRALEDANALDFVKDLPHDIDTLVGEKGTLLSGGQAQRIAIARALYKQASILIFDEATSALDSESERAIQDALEKTKGLSTRFVITHRMSTIQQADWLLVLDRGKLVQQGTEKTLRTQEGVYQNLLRGQYLLHESDIKQSKQKKLRTISARKKTTTRRRRVIAYNTKKGATRIKSIWRDFVTLLQK